MKSLLALIALTVAAFAADPVVNVDLYGNVFVDGENTNKQIGTFSRDNPDIAPQVDAAVRDAALAGREKIAADTQAAQDSAAAQVAAKEAEKQAAITAAQEASAAAIAANAAALDAAQATATAKTQEATASAAYVEKLKQQIVELGATPVDP